MVILKSEELKIYSETIAAFKADLKDHTIEEILIADKSQPAQKVIETLDKNPPAAVFALGSLALKTCFATTNKDIPCLYTFVLQSGANSDANHGHKGRGISLEVAPQTLLQQLKLLVPGWRSFYAFVSARNPQKSIPGLEFKPVSGTAEIEKHLENLKGKPDVVVWLPPDPVLMSMIDLKRIIKASQVAKIPLVVFSEAFVRAGGFASLSLNYETLGHQAAALLLNSLDSGDWPSLEEGPIGTYLVVNRKLAKEIGVTINPRLYQLMVDVVVD